ncbi:testis-expressed protein 13D-like [Erinaceus europaeus]|uniref:Testis-expressed protein 13D-like n=1 Tax=Erinaceus europaeus TaxID=9365 RepID=A0ABM3WPY0_ERIEU|nr:testis-expressed protein 13D-like [Erinaceus europaeus]
MAMDYWDAGTGFQHREVVDFINEEVRDNGGGPDSYVAFRSRSWNEVEDWLVTVVTDQRVPRALQRACTWSALALSVRVGARERELQARGVRRLQEQLEEHEVVLCALGSELQQLKQERDEVAAQLYSTRATLQQVGTDCDMLQGQLLQAQKSAQATHLAHEVPPGLPGQPPGSVTWLPNSAQPGYVAGVGMNGGLFFETLMPVPAAILYVPAPRILWAQHKQPSFHVPVPYLLPMQPAFPLGFPYLPTNILFLPSILVPISVSPLRVCLPGPSGAVGYQNDMASPWDQRSYIQGQGPDILQHTAPLEGIPIHTEESIQTPQGTVILSESQSQSQEEHPQRPQSTVPFENNWNYGHKGPKKTSEITPFVNSWGYGQGGPGMTSEMAPFIDSWSYDQKNPERTSEITSMGDSWSCAQDSTERTTRMTPFGDSWQHDQGEGQGMLLGMFTQSNNKHHSEERGPVWPQGCLDVSKTYCQEKHLQSLQGTSALGFSKNYNQIADSDRSQGMLPLWSNRSQCLEEEDLEGLQATFPGYNWIDSVKENSKKQHVQQQKTTQLERTSESQNQEKFALNCNLFNWVCPSCKTLNFSFYIACSKCKEVCMDIDNGDPIPEQIW